MRAESASVEEATVEPDISGPSIAGALAHARARLEAAGIATAALDARLLLQAATGLSTARLIADSSQTIGPAQANTFTAVIERRLASEPVARIVGEKEFWGLPLGISAATLVPRPETEIVVEAALHALQHFKLGPRIHICDLGTGSGAIAIALLSELPQARATALDISAGSLAQARVNAERLGLAARMEFKLGDFSEVPAGVYDLVVSNPPYVPSGDMPALTPEVGKFDPPIALDGGHDGLECYRRIARRLPDLVAPGGLIVLEFGSGQADQVKAIVKVGQVQIWQVRPDLAGIDRVLVARRRAAGL